MIPPIRDAWANGLPTPQWRFFFQAIQSALGGWVESISTTIDLDFLPISANSEMNIVSDVRGTKLGDVVNVFAPNTPGIIYTAAVTADNTVTVYAKNFTTSSINPLPATYKIQIFRGK